MQFIEILLRVETACFLILMIAVRESSKQHQVRILVDKALILYFLRRQSCTHVNCFFVFLFSIVLSSAFTSTSGMYLPQAERDFTHGSNI